MSFLVSVRECLHLSDTETLPWIAAPLATDACDPAAWRDDWLVSPRPSGGRPVIGATARTIDEWREYVVAGRGAWIEGWLFVMAPVWRRLVTWFIGGTPVVLSG